MMAHGKVHKNIVALGTAGTMLLSGCFGTAARMEPLRQPCDVAQRIPFNEPKRDRDTIDVLVFNIHDRPIAGFPLTRPAQSDGTMACVGDLAASFDLFLGQEAFVRPGPVAARTGHIWSWHSTSADDGGESSGFPFSLCPVCETSGLLMTARDEKPLSVHAETYRDRHGWGDEYEGTDSLFSKGFQLADFGSFWVLNSHMDTGRGPKSAAVRARQLEQIGRALEERIPSHAPLLVGMDSNLKPRESAIDAENLSRFLKRHGLSIVIQNGPDLIAVRNLDVEKGMVLPLKGVLSDHNALSATIRRPAGP